MWLNPLGFTKEEAEAMVGNKIVQLTKNIDGEFVSGRKGEIVASQQKPTFIGNQYEYFVAVQWQDRDGNFSKLFFLNKEQIRRYTRPLQTQKVDVERKATNAVIDNQQSNKTKKRRGFGI